MLFRSEQNIQQIAEQLYAVVDEDGKRNILLDFANVEYLSSAALSRLISLNKKVRGVNGQLRLCNIRPDLMVVFEITSLNKIFSIYPDEEKALGAFH